MAQIGLLSDAHGHGTIVNRAVELLVHHGAECLIYLGDVGNPEVIDALLVHQPGTQDLVPVHLVFGNVDWDVAELTPYAQKLGIQVDHPIGHMPLKNSELAYLHGDDTKAMDQLLNQNVKYLCHGHTHQAADVRRGSTRVINPGALYRATSHTVAILDTEKDELIFFPVGKS